MTGRSRLLAVQGGKLLRRHARLPEDSPKGAKRDIAASVYWYNDQVRDTGFAEVVMPAADVSERVAAPFEGAQHFSPAHARQTGHGTATSTAASSA